MAKRVLRYTEEEFITLLENIVNKVKNEQKRIDESRKVNSTRRTVNETRTSNRRNSNNNDRFRKLR